MRRAAGPRMFGIAAVCLTAATVAIHPRAAVPALAFCALLHAARRTRLAVVLLVVLMIGTLAGVRVDAARPALAGVER